MENPEEIMNSLEEFSKARTKDIPKELEDYLCFVAKTGDPVYQWSLIKNLFREKLINVITEFYEQCPSIDIPPCPNVDVFNYDQMKSFILEKLDTFVAAPFTVQRICELLTTPRKEYNRIDKYMRALEKNILVVSTTEPGNRHNSETGEGIVNGLESEHIPESSGNSDVNVEEMDDSPSWPRVLGNSETPTNSINGIHVPQNVVEETVVETRLSEPCSSDSVITCRSSEESYVSIEPVTSTTCRNEQTEQSDVSVTITAISPELQPNETSPPEVSQSTEEAKPLEVFDTKTEEKTPSNEVSMQLEEAQPAEPENTENSKVQVDIKAEETVSKDGETEVPESSSIEEESPVETSETKDLEESAQAVDEKQEKSEQFDVDNEKQEKSEQFDSVDFNKDETTNESTPESKEVSKADLDFEENSKDSEVSESSSSVTSNEDSDVNKESEEIEKSTDDEDSKEGVTEAEKVDSSSSFEDKLSKEDTTDKDEPSDPKIENESDATQMEVDFPNQPSGEIDIQESDSSSSSIQ